MSRILVRTAVAFGCCIGSLAFSPKAEANWFGLFGTHHRAQAEPVSCCPQPTVRAYVAPVVAAPAPVVAASPCTSCAAPAPIAVPETCMQTRCYQVPVTRYETRTNYQLVTTNQVSEVCEPVTTLQTSAYFDPCNCGYQQVTTPVTTMVRKQVVTPIQRYVAQHYTVPVTTYVQQCEQVPVTTMRMYVPAPAVAAAPPPAVAVPVPGAVAAAPPPAATGPALQAVPAGPGAAPQGTQQRIELPNAQREGAASYVQPNANANPNRREEISRTFRNGELVEENRRFVDVNENQPPPNGSTGAPLSPVPTTKPPASGSSYAVPQEQKPMPLGAKTASWSTPTPISVTLSKPYSL